MRFLSTNIILYIARLELNLLHHIDCNKYSWIRDTAIIHHNNYRGQMVAIRLKKNGWLIHSILTDVMKRTFANRLLSLTDRCCRNEERAPVAVTQRRGGRRKKTALESDSFPPTAEECRKDHSWRCRTQMAAKHRENIVTSAHGLEAR